MRHRPSGEYDLPKLYLQRIINISDKFMRLRKINLNKALTQSLLLVGSVFFMLQFNRCSGGGSRDKGGICILDSTRYPGDSSRFVYMFYRDFGLMGRSNTNYVAVEKAGKLLNEKASFYQDIQVMQLRTVKDSLFIITSNQQPPMPIFASLKCRVIVDTQTWKYPYPDCHPVR
jgi:hypothetical protein